MIKLDHSMIKFARKLEKIGLFLVLYFVTLSLLLIYLFFLFKVKIKKEVYKIRLG